MHSDWRFVVKEDLGRIRTDIEWLDPMLNGLTEPKDYTAWDLDAIEKSDVLFAFYDDTNPSGFGMNLEIGFAYAKNKVIILVDETDNRYMGMARECATSKYKTLEDGIAALRKVW